MEIKTKFPTGHFYSPVVDPATVKGYVKRARTKTYDKIAGVPIDISRMKKFWVNNVPGSAIWDFPATETEGYRYHFKNSSFGLGDGSILRAMLYHYRPSRIIEVGSGFSSACMLDTIDRHGIDDVDITIIDPYPERLRKILKNDLSRIRLIDKPVQDVPLELFAELGKNDLLFIDSTHVLKTGSDVHYELTEILPVLKSGVIIHFHDIQFPFEYPDAWIFQDNLSWNEAYALHTFLMFNERFRILFFNNLFGRVGNDLVAQQLPHHARHPESFGGSLWLERIGTS